MPVGLVKNDTPSSVSALRLTSAKRTRSSTWLLRGPAWHLQQRDDVFALVDEAGGDVDRLLGDVLARDRARQHDCLAVALRLDCLAREQLLDLLGRAAPGRAGRRSRTGACAPARSQTNIEIVPGTLPLTSSWFGDVTSASAMSALVSDTRAIGDADVDDRRAADEQRHRRRHRRRRSAPRRRRRRASALRPGRAPCCEPSTAEDARSRRRRTTSAESLRLSCPRMSLLLAHDFLRALVAADDFDGRRRGRRRRRRCRRSRRAGARGRRGDRRAAPGPASAAGRMPGVAGAVLSSGLRSAS